MSATTVIAAFGDFFKKEDFSVKIPHVGCVFPGMTTPSYLSVLENSCERKMSRMYNDKSNTLSFRDDAGMYIRVMYSGLYLVSISYKGLKDLIPKEFLYTTDKYTYLTDFISEDCMLRFIDDNTVMLKKAAGESTHILEPLSNIARPSKNNAETIQYLLQRCESKVATAESGLPTLEADDKSAERTSKTAELKKKLAELKEKLEVSRKLVTDVYWQEKVIQELQFKIEHHPEEVQKAKRAYNHQANGYFHDMYVEEEKIYQNESGFYRLMPNSDKTHTDMEPVYDETTCPAYLKYPDKRGNWRLLRGFPGESESLWASVDPVRWEKVTVPDTCYQDAKAYIARLAGFEYNYWEVVKQKDILEKQLSNARVKLTQLEKQLNDMGRPGKLAEEIQNIEWQLSDMDNAARGANF